MIKKLCVAALLLAPTVKADWLDDLAQLTSKGLLSRKDELSIPKAQSLMADYIKEDKAELARLDKLIELNGQEKGVASAGHDVSYKAQRKSIELLLKYHEKVARSLSEMPDNKKEKEKFIAQLAELKKLDEELKTLKKEFNSTKNTTDKIKPGAKLAAKSVEIEAKKAYIKATFLV